MEVTRGTLYAVYTLIYFRLRPKGEVADLNTLSDTLDAPAELSVQKCCSNYTKRATWLRRWLKRRYRLAKEVDKTTMREVMHIIQGDALIQECLIEDFHCDRFKKCAVLRHVRNIQKSVNDQLDKLTIGQLAGEMEYQENPKSVQPGQPGSTVNGDS